MDSTDSTSAYIIRGDENAIEESRFEQGEPIDDWQENTTLYAKGEHPSDFMLAGPASKWIIVSDEVRQIIEKHDPTSTQFLKVKVLYDDTNEEVGLYWVVNVLRHIEALDWEHTVWGKTSDIENKYPRDEYPTLYIMQEALCAEALKNIDIFRLRVKSKPYSGIYISERIKIALEQAKATKGLYFVRIPAY
jgi:hypothetical protein